MEVWTLRSGLLWLANQFAAPLIWWMFLARSFTRQVDWPQVPGILTLIVDNLKGGRILGVMHSTNFPMANPPFSVREPTAEQGNSFLMDWTVASYDGIIHMCPQNGTQLIVVVLIPQVQTVVKLTSFIANFSNCLVKGLIPIQGGIVGSINVSNDFDDITVVKTWNATAWVTCKQPSVLGLERSGLQECTFDVTQAHGPFLGAQHLKH